MENPDTRDRPQYAVFPEDEGGFAIDDQYYVGGEGLLVKPVTKEGAPSVDVYIADNQVSHLLSRSVHRRKIDLAFSHTTTTTRTTSSRLPPPRAI